jgi:hypothetical protein
MSDYSPNWFPGTPLEADEKISQVEKNKIVAEMKAAGASEKDIAQFWEDDQPE